MASISPLFSSSSLLLRTLSHRPIFRSQIKLNNINNNPITNNINSSCCFIVLSKRKLCVVSSNNNNNNNKLVSHSVTNSQNSVVTELVANKNESVITNSVTTDDDSVVTETVITNSVTTDNDSDVTAKSVITNSVTTENDSAVTESVEKNNNNNNKNEEMKGLGNMLEIRVGKIVKIWKHDEADSLYVEEVDIGEKTGEESSNRVICSGLVNYIPIHLLQDKKVVVLANLKPRNMRGVKSYGMLMAASDSSHENVELLEPPEDSLPGDRVWFGDVDEKDNLPDAASPNHIQKKKIWESVQPHLKTNASCVALLGKDVMRTSAGVVRCKSLKDANIS